MTTLELEFATAEQRATMHAAREFAMAEQRATMHWIGDTQEKNLVWLAEMQSVAAENPDAVREAVRLIEGKSGAPGGTVEQHAWNIDYFSHRSEVTSEAVILMRAWEDQFLGTDIGNVIMYSVWFQGLEKTEALVRNAVTPSITVSI